MTHTSNRTITWGILLAIVLIALTVSTAAAQTNTRLRPAEPAVNEAGVPQRTYETTGLPRNSIDDDDRDRIRHEYKIESEDEAGVRERERLELRDVDAAGVVKEPIRAGEREHIELKYRTETEEAPRPESFLEKARNVLLERRTEDRDDVRPEVRSGYATATPERLREHAATSTEARDEAREAHQEQLARIEKERAERTSQFIENADQKMHAAIERLDTLADRIESRIVKLEEAGYDMSAARTRLEDARGSILEAATVTDEALADAASALEENISREAFGKVAEALAHSKESLRDAHEALVDVIRHMKDSIGEAEQENTEGETETDTETSTAPTTPTTPGATF